MHVRLTSKIANRLNGVDVSRVRVGEIISVSPSVAAMLIAEGWAERVADPPTGLSEESDSSRERSG